MRNFRAWSVLLVLCVLVFAFSGCGGGSLDGSGSDEETQNPVSIPDTYSTKEVLKGSWAVINETYNFEAGDFSFTLNSARLSFDSIDMSESVATALVTSRQEWHSAYIGEDPAVSLGIRSLGLDFDSGKGRMIHQAKDKWRCNVSADNKILMNIAVSSDKIITVNYQGVTPALFNGMGAEYNFTLGFRKEE